MILPAKMNSYSIRHFSTANCKHRLLYVTQKDKKLTIKGTELGFQNTARRACPRKLEIRSRFLRVIMIRLGALVNDHALEISSSQSECWIEITSRAFFTFICDVKVVFDVLKGIKDLRTNDRQLYSNSSAGTKLVKPRNNSFSHSSGVHSPGVHSPGVHSPGVHSLCLSKNRGYNTGQISLRTPCCGYCVSKKLLFTTVYIRFTRLVLGITRKNDIQNTGQRRLSYVLQYDYSTTVEDRVWMTMNTTVQYDTFSKNGLDSQLIGKP